MIEHYKNTSLENIVEETDGVKYTEEWRYIKGYEDSYMVSSFGRVKRIEHTDTNKHKWSEIIVKSFSSYNYRRVGLSKNCKQVKYQVHRLVGAAFIPNPENLPEINHKKGVRWDNRFFMLEWNTSSENHKHAFDTLGKKANTPCKGRYGILHHNSIQVIQISLDGFILNVFESQTLAAKELSTYQDVVGRHIKNGKPFRGYLLM